MFWEDKILIYDYCLTKITSTVFCCAVLIPSPLIYALPFASLPQVQVIFPKVTTNRAALVKCKDHLREFILTSACYVPFE